jgi:hypothetical protein
MVNLRICKALFFSGFVFQQALTQAVKKLFHIELKYTLLPVAMLLCKSQNVVCL